MPRKPKKPVTSILAKNIKRLRDQHGWTQRQLAERIGHEEPAHISQMERGIRGAGVDIRKKLCEVFGVEEGELFRSESEWDVPREKEIAVHSKFERYEVEPSRKERRKRLVDQLDKILDHPKLRDAIAANLEAFSEVAELKARVAELEALRKELDELKTQNKILLDEISRSRRPEDGPERREAFKTIKQLIEKNDGGQP